MKIEERFFNSEYGQQYAITIQFELQRERQKNKILEERLRNKQIFIVEMKKMHSELELITQRCRQELIEQRGKREQLQKLTLREYLETIHELEHKIKYLQSNDINKNISKYDEQQLKRNKSAPRYHNNRNEMHSSNINMISGGNSVIKKNSRDQNGKQYQIYQDNNQVFKKFINRFLQMYFIYNSINYEQSIKKQLKGSWKWIKDVVKQWQQNKNLLNVIYQYCQKCINEKNECNPQSILKFQEFEECWSREQQN